MCDQRTDVPDDLLSLQPGILDLVLRRHPAQVHIDEVFRSSPEDRVLVEDAVMDLVADGLIHRHGDFVVPTRAAVRFRQLRL